MDLRGWLETGKGVDANGFPARYQEGAYCEYADREDRLSINQGGTAEDSKLLSLGDRSFFYVKIWKRSEKNVLSGL